MATVQPLRRLWQLHQMLLPGIDLGPSAPKTDVLTTRLTCALILYLIFSVDAFYFWLIQRLYFFEARTNIYNKFHTDDSCLFCWPCAWCLLAEARLSMTGTSGEVSVPELAGPATRRTAALLCTGTWTFWAWEKAARSNREIFIKKSYDYHIHCQNYNSIITQPYTLIQWCRVE